MSHTSGGFGTKAIHAGNIRDKQYGSLTMPIYQTSTFFFENCEQGGHRFAGEEEGYIYTRLGNPTTSVLENKVAALENGEACVATSSGIGAISSCLWSIAGAGKHILADETLYGCTFALLQHGMTRYGVEVTFINTSDLEAVKANLKENTVCIYLETPANPNLKIADISEISKIAHAYNPKIKVVCDNTFASPYLQRPLELGADVVVHSATKYLNGHGDVIAGFVVGKGDFMKEVRFFGLKDMTGAVIGPFESFLILRGLKTLEIRMQRHCASAKAVAEFLAGHDKVEKVYYPGLESHPGHEIAKKQMHDFGAMISFEVKGGKEAGMKFVNSLTLATIAVSLGDAETLIEHPASMTHSTYAEDELKAAGISAGLIRISIGLENVEDIIEDLKMGLEKI
ncbi:methionine gamma-lyase [Anaerotignum neopropionicum]|uniref:L-methionine gamma-lyase n=1 Tax=Anaerotignum neopropionicum TaxID=36847 RepID=A0A136WBI1_9FIRM|nr:methionine gamma-lyase [Anaerotignum neopropionicum]KXL51872.1 methionine gamma-lyase [Anaerotignum neopropionicum]